MCSLLQATTKKVSDALNGGCHRFDARNNSQVYAARDLAKAYAEYYALCCFKKRCTAPEISGDLTEVLELLFFIYGYWCLDKHMSNFYQGGFESGANFVDSVRSGLLVKCSQLKDIAVSVADALAAPDFALNSVIGKSDGLLYQNLQHEFMMNPGAFERPSWWKDVIIPPTKSKL